MELMPTMALGVHPIPKPYYDTRYFRRLKHPEKGTIMPKVGKRQARINRLVEYVTSSQSSPENRLSATTPIYNPPNKEQIRRGYKNKRNNQCPCGSGLKYKNCHKEDEKETVRISYDELRPFQAFNPETGEWIKF